MIDLPNIPDGFEKIAVFYKGADIVIVARSNHHIGFFTWDGVSGSWYKSESFIELK